MSKEILKFIHDDGTEFCELLKLVGKYLANAEVNKQLGHPVSTTCGDIWLVAKDGESVVGFCIISMQKNSATLHGLYVMPYSHSNGLYFKLADVAAKEAWSAQRKRISHTTIPEFTDGMEKGEWKLDYSKGKFLVFTKNFLSHYKVSTDEYVAGHLHDRCVSLWGQHLITADKLACSFSAAGS